MHGPGRDSFTGDVSIDDGIPQKVLIKAVFSSFI